MIERRGDDAQVDHLGLFAVAGKQAFELAGDRRRPGSTDSFRHAVADEQDPPPTGRRGDREVRPPESVGVELVDLAEPVGPALQQQPVVDEPSPHHLAELGMPLGRHLVRDAIEPPDLGDGKEHAEEDLLTRHDHHQRHGGEEPRGPASATSFTPR